MLRFFTFFLFFVSLSALAQTHTPRYVSMTGKTAGYYEYLPQGYDANGTTTYPLILFMTGIGEFGNGSASQLPLVLRHGVPQEINAGTFPASFTVGNQTFRFIVITPQFIKFPRPEAEDMDSVLNYIVAHYKVDVSRIYITGLSYGGGLTFSYAGHSAAYAQRVAAAVPVASPIPDGGDTTIYERSRVIAANNVAVWATHNLRDSDDTVATTITYINDINLSPAPTPLAQKTIFNASGHNAWDRTYDPTRHEFAGLNVYEWMLQYQRGTASVNQPPTAAAGADQTITLPTNSVTLTGSGTDADGSIKTYSWTKISGPAGGAITTPNSATTTVTALQQGSYTFRLTVTDNDGATASDAVAITVNAAPNQAPTANAGADQTITLPTNAVMLTGEGKDADGTIVSYNWIQVSGPGSGTITNAAGATTTVTGLVQGTYTFRVTVTDNTGATASDDVVITVNAAPNQPPTVTAGPDITLTLPTNSTTLTGTATDADGTIVQYTWTKVSGPASGTVTTPDKSTTTLTNLVAGAYTLRLTVKDNDGAAVSDDVVVTVNAATNNTPVANAGADVTITLPTNQVNLSGSGADADGQIASFIWSQVSGPAGAVITKTDAAATAVTNLVQGSYVFRLTVTDNDGATASDDVAIVVNAAPNQAPTVNAGADQTITLPTSTVTLMGTAVDADGTISQYDWTKVSGPASSTIATADKATTVVSGLIAGTYSFRLTVTDNNGATASDDVTITVNTATNKAPTANAGADITITLPTNTATITGSGTDADGSIALYTWTKTSGPAGLIFATPGQAATTISGLVQGTYVLRLTVTDDKGATAFDEVTITVLAAPANHPPHADAGADQQINLPTNTITLHGTATDSDGTITGVQWIKVSGPAGGNISTPTGDSTVVTGLQQGTYVFRFTVTDNKGDTASDDVAVAVSVVTAIGDDPATADYRITVAPNPSHNYFSLKLLSPNAKPGFLQVTDAIGRIIEQRNNIQRNSVFTVGQLYRPGVYYIQVVQAGRKRTVTLLKLP